MKYYWTYDECLAPKEKTDALKIGDVVHHVTHLYNTQTLKLDTIANLDDVVRERYPGEPNAQELAEISGKLLTAYVNKIEDKSIRVIASEMHVEVEEAEFFVYGRIDGLGRTLDERLWRLETKTTSKMDSLYLSGLKSGLQSGIYHYILRQTLKEKLHGTIFILLVKVKIPYCEPNIVPISPEMVERSLKTFEGVARQIKQGDFYPSSECVGYNRECDYLHLCNNLHKESRLAEVKQAFYKHRESATTNPGNKTTK